MFKHRQTSGQTRQISGQTSSKQIIKHRQTSGHTSSKEWSDISKESGQTSLNKVAKHRSNTNDVSCGPPRAANRPSSTQSSKVVNTFIARSMKILMDINEDSNVIDADSNGILNTSSNAFWIQF
jgi:hypothetical protein